VENEDASPFENQMSLLYFACNFFFQRRAHSHYRYHFFVRALVMAVENRCKISVDAPILEAVVKACEQSGQWERAEALRKEFPGSVRAEDSNNDMSAKA
jgi:hypothetical protein